MKQGRRAQKFILPYWWTYVIWKVLNWRQSTKSTKVELYSEATLWKTILDLTQYSPNKDHQHLKWHGYHLQIARLRWTSSGRSNSKNPSKNRRCSQIVLNSQIGMPRHLDSSTTTDMVQYGRPSRSSWAKSVRSSFNRTFMGKAIWKIPLHHGWEKVSNWECLFVHREKWLFLSVYVDDIKIGWKETKHWSDVESTQ